MADQKGAAEGVSAEDVAAEFATLKADIARLTETVRALISNEAEHAAGTVRGHARAAATKAGEAVDRLATEGQAAAREAKIKAGEAATDLTHLVERNPIGSVAAAFGIGFLIGLLTRRK